MKDPFDFRVSSAAKRKEISPNPSYRNKNRLMTTEGRKLGHISNRHGSVGANHSIVRSELES